MRVRFAPSPTGHLHVGNARTALFNWLLARGHGGVFVLRIEDTDVERSTEASERAIMEDLRWLGLEWDEGPDVGGPYGPYRQSERLDRYRRAADRLIETGRAYYCFCSPEQLEADRARDVEMGRPPRYAGRCRTVPLDEARVRIGSGEPAVVRLRVPDRSAVSFDDQVRGRVTFSTDVIGDPVLLRSDGRPAYNFAVVVDDSQMAITHVVRGEDHLSNTPRQVLVYEALDLVPPVFAHLALVLGPDHTPLSKRHGATSVSEFRAKGYLPEALFNYLALIGWSPGDGREIQTGDELARRFSLADVGRSPGVFDEDKLAWMNRHYLRAADPRRLAELAIPYLQRAGYASQPDTEGLAFLAEAVGLASGSVDRLDQVPARFQFLFRFDPPRALEEPAVRAVLEQPGAFDVIRSLARQLSSMPRLTRETFREMAARVRQQTGRKGRELFHPIRVALTGEAAGPELDLAVPVIDRGAELPAACGIAPITGCRERAAAFWAALQARTRHQPPTPNHQPPVR